MSRFVLGAIPNGLTGRPKICRVIGSSTAPVIILDPCRDTRGDTKISFETARWTGSGTLLRLNCCHKERLMQCTQGVLCIVSGALQKKLLSKIS